jgi:hypothetical protein
MGKTSGTKITKTKKLGKRPLNAYMIFMSEFRVKFNSENPDTKGVVEVAKAGGTKWRALPEDEKNTYKNRALVLKEAEVEKTCVESIN